MQAFEDLFNQYFERVYHFTLSLTRNYQAADELTQQTFFKALKRMDSFQGRSDPVTWLCSIATNEYLNNTRRNRELTVEPDSPVLKRNVNSIDDLLLRNDEVMQIHRLLHALSEPYREVFSLRVFGELKFSQIASLFSKTESWARVTFYRAKCELQIQIREENDHDK